MDAADLYGLPLDRFVPERTALAKALRGDGDRAEAGAVAKLAKPSVAAWAVNQLIRTQRREVTDLFEAGDALRGAQEDVVAGRGNARALREASERERVAVSALLERARGLLGSEGHGLSQLTLDRVADTLHAAALEPEARAEVQQGCLTRELRHVGLGEFALAAGPPPRSREASPPVDDERRARAHEARLEAARKAEAKTRRLAERTVRELETARARRDRAAVTLREAEEGVAGAEARAAEAAQAHESAQTELDEL